MVRERERAAPARVSLDDADATERGLFGSGKATIKESFFGEFDYGGFLAVCWIVRYVRDGEGYDQPYSIGSGWKASKDGTTVTNRNNDPGLPKNCNAMLHLVKPLKAALKAAGIDNSVLAAGDPTVLEGMEVVVERVDQVERDDMPERGGRGGGRDRGRGRGEEDDDRGGRGRGRGRERDNKPKTILEIEEVISAPWDKGSGKKRGRDDDEPPTRRGKVNTERDENDEEEAPRRTRGKTKDDDEPKPRHRNRRDEVDEEEEKPRRGRGRDEEEEKPTRGRGRGRDAEPEGDDEQLAEAGVEALLAALDKGALPYAKLEQALAKVTKGEKDQDAIIEWCLDKANLKTEKGWSYDGKTLELA